MNEHQYHERLRDFAGPIETIAMNNAVVYRIIQMYVSGQIVTKEEALSQMVVALAKDWDAVMKKNYDLAMSLSIPMR